MDFINSISSSAPIELIFTFCVAAFLAFWAFSAVAGSNTTKGHSKNIHHALLHGDCIPDWLTSSISVAQPSLTAADRDRLAKFQVSPTRGFLPHLDPLERSGIVEMDAIETACAEITGLLRAGIVAKTRACVVDAAEVALAAGAEEAIMSLRESVPAEAREQRRCLLALSILCNGYAWCGGAGNAVKSLPNALSRLLVAAAAGVGVAPILTHCSIVLNNFRRIDCTSTDDLSTGNLEMISGFLHSSDEAFFFLVTVEIEWRGAPIPAQLCAAQRSGAQLLKRLDSPKAVASLSLSLEEVLSRGAECVERASSTGWDTPAKGSSDAIDRAAIAAAVLILRLRSVAAALQAAQATISRMSEGCNPDIFYNEIRPFLAGWKSNPALPDGMVYGDVDKGKPRQYFGGSAAQSSLMQAADAGLGIKHARGSTADFLDTMRDEYMPRQHAAFIRELASGLTVKTVVDAVVAACSEGVTADTSTTAGALVEAFNVCVGLVAEFRSAHMGIVGEFILGPQARAAGKTAKGLSGTAGGKGTGGTDLMSFLRPLRDGTWGAAASAGGGGVK